MPVRLLMVMDNVREILLAAEAGNVSKIREYISSGRINVVDEEGSSPLMYAAANGAEKIVRLVLQSDVNVNQQNHYGWTALLQASCYGHHEVVYTLLQSKANIDLCNNWGATPLVAAAQGGFTTVVQVLLEKNATVTTADEVVSITPLMAAAQCGNETIIKLLLDHQSNPNTRYAPIGWTALMFAALNNHAPVVKELLSRGAVREMRDVNNQRAIDLASSSGLTDVVSILSEDDTATPSSDDIDIFQAVKQENMNMLTEVIKKHKVSVTVTDKDGATPLMYAARKGNVKACQMLLDHGADFDAQDQIHRWTAFMHAVHHGHYKIAKLLAQYGANVNLRAKNGSSAFDIANLIGDARTIHLIAEITIQRLTEKNKANSSPPVSAINEEPEIPIRSPSQSLSPQPPGDDEAVNILRRVSNAYLASGDMPSHLDLVRSGSHSPYAHKSPSPDPNSIDDICLPAITKPTPSFLMNNKLSPSPPGIISPPALLKVPQRQNSGKKKGTSTQSSTKDGVHSFKVQQPSFPNASPSMKKPNFHLPLSPFTDNNSVSGYGPSRNKDLPQIKSPRSLPTETFNFLKNKGPPSAVSPKGSQFLRSSSKYKLPPNFSSSAERPKSNGGGGGGWPNLHPADLKLGEKSRVQSSTRITSFDKIKLPVAHKGQDLKTILENASLGQYYSAFEEEEIIDISSFLTLSDKDLIELGITDSSDRKRVVSLISQLKDIPVHPRSPLSPKPPLSAGSFRFH